MKYWVISGSMATPLVEVSQTEIEKMVPCNGVPVVITRDATHVWPQPSDDTIIVQAVSASVARI